MDLPGRAPKSLGFTCAGGWNGYLRASCTMQNLSIITLSTVLAANTPANTPANPPRKPTMQHATVSPSPAIRHALLTASIALGLIAAPSAALAKRTSDKPATTNAPTKKKGVNKVTYQRSSSEETTAERDRRMYRECKGMHNAGACRGYTRK